MVVLAQIQMEESRDNPSQVNRFQVDEMHNLNIVEWTKKRKLQAEQLDLLRPKHKCWVGSFSSEHPSMFDENPVLEGMHNHTAKSTMDASFLEERSEPESAKDSNSFMEDCDTAMSVNEESKHEADCGNTYLYGRPSTSLVNCDDYINRVSYTEEEAFVDGEYIPPYDDADAPALNNDEEHLLGLGSFSGHECSEYAKDSNEYPVDKEFEDFLFSNGVNPNVYVLSSGRWNIIQEAQSSSRPPTIDQEFEEYFSTLML
ncbi:Protein FAR-RED ELONGATED HYPOCOTYL 1, partial [Mucuna pruriens]